ncbi:MAG: helix-turn-helix domain-containing protein [Acholeplasmatales bacterium]|nr:helix-turn-helix domain-containing protein [Acholeplasmatales bacterium]
MDMIKVGRFISTKRKEQNLTQMQLAEKLSITDRAVSKWECGKALPDSSIMIELCEILNISVNELLTGEEIEMEKYDKQVEKNLIELVKQKEESDKRLLNIEIVLMAISITFFIAIIAIVSFVDMPLWAKIVIGIGGFIQLLASTLICFRIEQKAGYYECQECHHRYVPTFLQSSIAPHMGRTKYMKCPKCGKKSWQRKVISKKDND